jgi:hypothetical protein
MATRYRERTRAGSAHRAGFERWCEEDVACRVIAANRVPDHTTIARFRRRHQDALAGVFGEVLGLCAEAGLVAAGLIAIDGTKVHANASERATRAYERIAREILAEADAVDREEDERFGERRGDELAERLVTGAGRAVAGRGQASPRAATGRGGAADPGLAPAAAAGIQAPPGGGTRDRVSRE